MTDGEPVSAVDLQRRRARLIAGLPSMRSDEASPAQPEVRGGFFGTVWFVVAGGLVVLGAATDRSGLVIIGLLGLLSAGLAWATARVALRDVTVSAALDQDHALLDDEVTVTVSVRNDKWIPVPWASLEIEVARGLFAEGPSRRRLAGEQVLRLTSAFAPFGRLTWRARLRTQRRGVYPIGPITVRAGDPFGFFSAVLAFPGPLPIVVYPAILGVTPRFRSREQQGEARVRHNLFTDPARIAGVRDYQPGDPFRMIAWKATARLGTLQTRLEEPSTAQQVRVVLNLDTHEYVWEGVDAPLAETTIVAAASILTWADAAGYEIGLTANGLLPGTAATLAFAPARGTGQLIRCLDGLARLALMSTVSFTNLLNEQARHGERGGIVVVVTAQITDFTVAAVAAVRHSGRQVVVVPTGGAIMPRLDGVTVLRLDEAAIRERLGLEGEEPERANTPAAAAATASEPAGS